ncbi:MAG: ECF transporter S component [Provencibacterium sp.]|jgi:uncharacterized membrane protein|nr:ECF transporter S component [Provencibacterium sp.]
MPANQKTREMTQTALLMAIIVLLALVPAIGYIPVGPIRATTIHIPVIIGAILLGPKRGAALGLTFGLTSLCVNTFTPTAASFVFSPFIPIPGTGSGSPLALIIALVPRTLIGVVAGLVFWAFEKRKKARTLACILAGFAGSITNTILVMGGIYLFFGESYAAVNQLTYEALLSFIGGVIALNGVVEALVAAALATLIARPLFPIVQRGRAQ